MGTVVTPNCLTFQLLDQLVYVGLTEWYTKNKNDNINDLFLPGALMCPDMAQYIYLQPGLQQGVRLDIGVRQSLFIRGGGV